MSARGFFEFFELFINSFINFKKKMSRVNLTLCNVAETV